MSDLAQALASLEAAAQADIAGAADVSAIDAVRVRYLGRKGSLAAILRGLGSLDAAARPLAGKRANEVKARVEAALDARRGDLVVAARSWPPTSALPRRWSWPDWPRRELPRSAGSIIWIAVMRP